MVSFQNALILAITGAYLLFILGVGWYAARRTVDTSEDFYVASRTFGTIVLLFALYATNMTAVTMIGAPGLTYQSGVSSMGFFTGLWILLSPIVLMTVGYRIWIAGKRFGHTTPGEFFDHRWESSYLGIIASIILIFWSIPVIQTGVMGAGISFEALTDGLVPFWLGALVIVAVVAVYVLVGGMRATGYTNTIQGSIFIAFLLILFVWIPLRLGGFVDASTATAQIQDGFFVNRAGFPLYTPRAWFSFGIIVVLSVIVLPWLFQRVLTAKNMDNLKRTGMLYPIAILAAWVPAVMIGFWGVAAMPDVENPDFILPLMIEEFLPFWVLGFALVGILAAIMSSFDGIVQTLSTMFTVDFALKFYEDLSEKHEVHLTRIFVVFILAAAYLAAVFTEETIIGTGIIFLQGFAGVFVPLTAALYWAGSTEESVAVGLLVGFFGFWGFELGILPEGLMFGFLPFIPVLVIQVVSMVLVALVTSPPSQERIEAYEKVFPDRW